MSTSIISWADQLAAQADAAASAEKTAGQFYSLKSGVLSLGGVAVPNNKIVVVIIDSIYENTLYQGRFDPNNLSAPTCYAFGRVEHSLEPHKDVENAEAPACLGCPMNEWGSSDTGRGKACKNIRRLALIDAGTVGKNGGVSIFDDAEGYAASPISYLKVPVTSTKEYSNFVKKVSLSLRRPPHGIITVISVVPDTVSQFKVTFTPQIAIPDELMPAIMARHEEAKALSTGFTYKHEEGESTPTHKKSRKF